MPADPVTGWTWVDLATGWGASLWSWLWSDKGFLVAAYVKTYRGSFFTGFLTLGSLLLALNTFSLGTLRKDLYENDSYKKLVQELHVLDRSVDLFDPLKNLSGVVYRAMAMAFIASFAQLVVGAFETNLTALIGYIFAVVAFYLLLQAMMALKANLDSWRKHLPPLTPKEVKASLLSEPKGERAPEVKSSPGNEGKQG